MKTFNLSVTGIIVTMVLAIASVSSQAQGYLTNLVAYNFDTNQVNSPFPFGSAIWSGSGSDFVSVEWDATTDASNNPASGSMLLTINCNGGQYSLFDGFSPWYSPVPLQGAVVFTNISWDMRYDGRSAIRTNTAGNGVNGSQGVGSLDFGYMRIGSVSQPPDTFGQDWYYSFAIPATNGLGNPNTNWIHVSIPLATTAGTFPDLEAYGIADTMFGQSDAGFGNNVLKGNQYIWFDNIKYTGFTPPQLRPQMSIFKPTPALRLFSGSTQFGRSQITLADNNETWIGGPFPITYSMTLLNNISNNFPTAMDTHIQIISGNNNYSGADFTSPATMWLQIIAGGNGTNVSCTARIANKIADPGANPTNIILTITNPVRAGKWTWTFLSDTNGTLTAPGASAVAWSITNITDDVLSTNFVEPVQVRFGLENNGNASNGGIPDDWASITVSGTAGLSGTNYTENFTQEGTNLLNTAFWNLATSDGAGDQVLVPTNAAYWITWNLPDSGFVLTTSTNIGGSFSSWILPEFYNSYSDGSNSVGTQVTQNGVRWNLMLPAYLPTADGDQGTNEFDIGGPPSPKAFFRLQTNPPPM